VDPNPGRQKLPLKKCINVCIKGAILWAEARKFSMKVSGKIDIQFY
jgi:hypothetical protein